MCEVWRTRQYSCVTVKLSPRGCLHPATSSSLKRQMHFMLPFTHTFLLRRMFNLFWSVTWTEFSPASRRQRCKNKECAAAHLSNFPLALFAMRLSVLTEDVCLLQWPLAEARRAECWIHDMSSFTLGFQLQLNKTSTPPIPSPNPLLCNSEHSSCGLSSQPTPPTINDPPGEENGRVLWFNNPRSPFTRESFRLFSCTRCYCFSHFIALLIIICPSVSWLRRRQ